jgi:tetratricopeptide (TPR) repeat protein
MSTISAKVISPSFKIGFLSLAVFILAWFALPWGLEFSRQIQAGALIEDYLQRNAAPYKNYFTCVLPLITQLPPDNNVNQAVKLLEKAAQNPPTSPHTHYLLGKAYCLKGNFEAAVYSLETFYTLRPKNPLGSLELGFAYYSWAQLSSNEAFFEDSVQAFTRADVNGQLLLAQGDQAYNSNLQLTAWIMYNLAAMFVELPEITTSKLADLEENLAPADLLSSIIENDFLTEDDSASSPYSEASVTETPSPIISPESLDTSTPTLGPALKTPFGPLEHPFLVYQASEGDSLRLIADQYNTTVEILEKINDFSLHPLWIGDIVVVCVGCLETPELPKLKAIYLETDVAIDALAQEVGAPVEDLRHWNGLEDGDWIIAPRWVIIPLNN